MDSSSSPNLNFQTSSSNNKNMIIGLLVFLLILSFLGINLLMIFGNFLQSLVNTFGPIVKGFLALLGFTAGTVLNKTSDVVGDTAKLGIDLAEGAVHDVGDLLIQPSKNVSPPSLDLAINKSPIILPEIKPDDTSSVIQNSITSNKTKWCLVGEYQGRRGCIEIGENDTCLSGQIYPDRLKCINPALCMENTCK